MLAELGDFPVDESTLQALEHAMGGALTFDRPDGAPDDGGPWLVGAEYSMSTLLDFLAGCTGEDPNQEVLEEGLYAGDSPRIVYDTRVHYSERDVIKALIAEVRRLREDKTQKWDYFYEKPVSHCARMDCEARAVMVIDELLLCGKHYKEHTE